MVEMKPIQKIPLQEIDLSDETFSVNFKPDLEKLRSSIEEVGLIQPVLLREKGDRYQILSGFRRISVFRKLGNPDIEAKVYKEKEMEDLGFFSISLHENLTTRGYNAIEKAMALDKLVHDFQMDPLAMINTFLPLFSLEPHEKILKTYLSLARMEDEVKRYVLEQKVSRTNIRKLSSLVPEDRRVVLRLLSPLKLGENSLREVLALLEEITRRDRLKLMEIVDRREIQAILSHQELTPSQRTERVKMVLMDLRYPRRQRLEQIFEEKRKALNLPPGISVHHQPHFEGKGLTIELRFETLEEYRALLKSLSALVEKDGLKEMLSE